MKLESRVEKDGKLVWARKIEKKKSKEEIRPYKIIEEIFGKKECRANKKWGWRKYIILLEIL